MRKFLQVLMLFAVIGQFNGDVLAKTVINFGTCEIQITDLVDDGRTMFLQRAIVKEKNSGLVRKIKTFQLTDSFSATDFPIAGIDTFVIKEWTGGAYCCYSYYIITHKKSSERTHFQVITSGRGEGDIAIPKALEFVGDRPALELVDSFWIPDMVWWPRWGLCHADSPYPTRVILFDSELLLWEDIRPNQLKDYYRRKYKETIQTYRNPDPNENPNRFSLAVEAGYYAYMAGDSKTKLERILFDMVPKEYRDKKSKSVGNIAERIIQRANSFQAVEFWSPN